MDARSFVRGPWTARWLGSLAVLFLSIQAAGQIDTAFTYQGKLMDNGVPANSSYEMLFRIFDAESGGSQVGFGISSTTVVVTDGHFTMLLDFGTTPFTGEDRWLDIEVDGVPLTPRQPITSAPFALQTRGIFVDNDGEVGIGTTDPDGTFHIAGTTPSFVLQDDNSIGSGTRGAISLRDTNGDEQGWMGYVDSNRLEVGTLSGGILLQAASQQALFSTSGRLGIGTMQPQTTLHAQSGTDVTVTGGGYVQLGPTSGDNVAIDNNEIMARSNSQTSELFLNHNGGDVIISAFGTGWVAIGTPDPDFRLHVNGTAGKPGGGSWSSTSDRRLKQNVEPMRGALGDLLALRGVTFEYLDPDSINELPGQRIGMIAQDVERVFPDWVDEREDGYLTVTYRGFEALAVEAMRELHQENQSLRARLTELEQLIEGLLAHDNDADERNASPPRTSASG